jgi:diphthamide synthase subunit DPH2
MQVIIKTKEGHKAYSMKPKKAKELVKTIKSEMKNHTIIAVEKGSTLELRKDTFDTAAEMLAVKQSWIKKGYKVYSTNLNFKGV